MEKVDAYKKASVASVVISVVSVLISMASAAGQLATKKGEVGGSAEIGIAIAAGIIYAIHQIRNWIKKRNESKKALDIDKKTGIEFTHFIDVKVKHEENGMFKEYPYLRSFIIHFHNGDFTDAGLSLIKMTIKHEVLGNRTVKKISENYQGEPVPEMFFLMLKRVVFQGHYFIKDREEIKTNVPLYQWMEIYDVGSMLFVEIRAGSSHKIVAILVMQWKIKDGINEEQIPQIKEDKKKIEKIYDSI